MREVREITGSLIFPFGICPLYTFHDEHISPVVPGTARNLERNEQLFSGARRGQTPPSPSLQQQGKANRKMEYPAGEGILFCSRLADK
ncbi:MAG: hypothetical protein GX364_00615 [Firmicutes bacterium]|nr:hypothetical protein [Bacillota bacterium]